MEHVFTNSGHSLYIKIDTIDTFLFLQSRIRAMESVSWKDFFSTMTIMQIHTKFVGVCVVLGVHHAHHPIDEQCTRKSWDNNVNHFA